MLSSVAPILGIKKIPSHRILRFILNEIYLVVLFIALSFRIISISSYLLYFYENVFLLKNTESEEQNNKEKSLLCHYPNITAASFLIYCFDFSFICRL